MSSEFISDTCHNDAGVSPGTHGFQTFVMTGSMMIQVDAPSNRSTTREHLKEKTGANEQCTNGEENGTYDPTSQNDTDTIERTSDMGDIDDTKRVMIEDDLEGNEQTNHLICDDGVKDVYIMGERHAEDNENRMDYVTSVVRADGKDDCDNQTDKSIHEFINSDEDVKSQDISGVECDNDSSDLDSCSCSTASLSSLDNISLDMNHIIITPPNQVDEPSASRLAKRLYYLDGFKRSDVSYHLTRNNQFAQKVTEEYLKYFDFKELTLVESMREFFNHFVLMGETQERERVLLHFTRRYIGCNRDTLGLVFNSEDACHTLVCALMLLNTDLHGQNLGKKMALSEFIANLEGFNQECNYPKDLLKSCYNSIKNEPFVWATDTKDDIAALQSQTNGINTALPADLRPSDHPVLKYHTLPANTLVSVADTEAATEYKRGVLLKKCCKGPDGQKVGVGKRAWKRYFVILKDMVLYFLKSERYSLTDPSTKAILIHHSLASVARSYRKRPYVFSLQTADWSEYLFATNWELGFDAVNSWLQVDQCKAHQDKVTEIRNSIADEEMYIPKNGSSRTLKANHRDKLIYLQYELQRYLTYAQLLRAKLDEFPDLEMNLTHSTIGEVEEEPTIGDVEQELTCDVPLNKRVAGNRYSYQQAVLTDIH